MGQTTSVHVSLTQVVSSSPAQAAAFYYNLQNHMRFNQLAHSIEVLESSGPATGPASAQPATATTSGSEAPVGCWQRYLFIERVPVLCGLSYMENVLTGKIRWQEPAGGAEAQHLLLQVTARNGATGVVVEVTGSAEFSYNGDNNNTRNNTHYCLTLYALCVVCCLREVCSVCVVCSVCGSV